MGSYDDELKARVAACRRTGVSSTAHGRALEELVSLVFSEVPGVAVSARNAKSVFENEELDLVMTNRGIEDGLPGVGPFFSVECKNWTRPVGSTEVSWFATKLRRSNQSFGVLVAANGVTGSAAGSTAAHFEAAAALAEGQVVVVLTLNEIEWLDSGQVLARLLVEKHARLLARREIFIADKRPEDLFGFDWHGRTREARNDRLRRVALEVSVDGASPANALSKLRTVVDEFVESEAGELALEDPSDFDAWSDSNLRAFEAVQEQLAQLAKRCIAALRARPGESWSVSRIELGIDARAPRNLEAPPDSTLAVLLTDYWVSQLKDGPGWEQVPSLLCLVDWSIEWLVATDTDRWPPPLV
jgi:hypothetical protein